jgi:hypothetical protein
MKLGFGKFSDKTLQEVVTIQPTYIDWCAKNVERFYLPPDVIEDLKKLNTHFRLTEEAIIALKNKFDTYDKLTDELEKQDNNKRYYKSDHEDLTNWQNYNSELDMDQQDISFWNQF